MKHSLFLFFILGFYSCSQVRTFEKEKTVSEVEKKICGKKMCSVLKHGESLYTVTVFTKDLEQISTKDISLEVSCNKSSHVADMPVHLKKIERTSKLIKTKKNQSNWQFAVDDVGPRCELQMSIIHKDIKEKHLFQK